MKKSPILHKWQPARCCDKCGYMSSGADFVSGKPEMIRNVVQIPQTCPNCSNKGYDKTQMCRVRVVEYTLAHKFFCLIMGYGWPMSRWEKVPLHTDGEAE